MKMNAADITIIISLQKKKENKKYGGRGKLDNSLVTQEVYWWLFFAKL